MHFDLNDELKELQAKARRFVERELIPHEMEVDETETLPIEVREHLKKCAVEEGLWPMNVPKELGGLGSSVLAQCIVQEQAGRATNGLWSFVGGPYNALMKCNEEQRAKYLEPALEGDWTAAYAVSEPEAGSDTTKLQTRAVKRGDKWVIDGEKWFVSGGESSLAVICHAVTGPGEETLFLVDKGTPGMRIKRIPRFMHRHPDRHPQILFENCEVPDGRRRRPAPDRGGEGLVRRARDLRAQAARAPGHRLDAGGLRHRDLRGAHAALPDGLGGGRRRRGPQGAARQVLHGQALLRGAGPPRG
jgi:alkylation response protein AidB-like acyl-CoA dehydrogenase